MTDHIPSSRPAEVVDHFFRHESGRIMSFLIKSFGKERLEVIEDAVQDALVQAMKTWSFTGTPKEPSAWILRVARNKVIDQLRRKTNFDSKTIIIKERTSEHYEVEFQSMDSQFNDDLLKMMFACCHPSISPESQIILVLKILGGFGKAEIARALMKTEDAVAKAYTRAKSNFKKNDIVLEVPDSELDKRLNNVLKIIYLLFNEGYNSISNEELIRKDLCLEAIRLNKTITDNPKFDKPEANALMALMCFQASRFNCRIDADGRMLTLESQDRKKWNHELIAIGNYHLSLSTKSGSISEYHLQASIAACHSFANSFEETNWVEILKLYDTLLILRPNAIASLNRIVASCYANGPSVALAELERLDLKAPLKESYLFYSIRAFLYEKDSQPHNVIIDYTRAKTLTKNNIEREYLEQKIKILTISTASA
ncbi:sigma-70 family RNA polymerase sigma factor [Fulvivirga ulvae]|uniref:RNA polymerase sigma factor n=1 Tax=Fulvivirga ulvae TaxID=2904245 RepID=UPI001F3CD3FD|nr:sigma-70 family RNA polymerase sigma factor [Fulvivirga ulvae]UII34329.1 sigma-70 family RNA polymerase sigma factor [Fulvivirga ulvae]